MGSVVDFNKIRQGNQGQMQVNIPKKDLISAETVTCKCGSKVFIPGIAFKKIPGIMVGSPNKYEVIPIQGVFVCAKCGEVSPVTKDDHNLSELLNLNENK